MRLRVRLGLAPLSSAAVHGVVVHAFTPVGWRAFRSMDPRELEAHVAHGLIPDDSSALHPERWRAAGWSTRALGRPTRRSPR
jgi:UDPglucose 6-dehydrogenase